MVQRQDGNLGDVDAAKVKDRNSNEVFAPKEHHRRIRLFQIRYMVTNSGVVDRCFATSTILLYVPRMPWYQSPTNTQATHTQL